MPGSSTYCNVADQRGIDAIWHLVSWVADDDVLHYGLELKGPFDKEAAFPRGVGDVIPSCPGL